MHQAGHSYPRNFTGERYPEKKRRFVLVRPTVFTYNFADTLTLTDQFDSNRILYRLIEHTLTFSQAISKEGSVYFISIEQDIVFDQIIKNNAVRYYEIIDTATFTDTTENMATNISQTITFSDEVTFYRILNRSFSDTVTFTGDAFVNSPRLININDVLSFFDDYDARNATRRYTFSDTITLGQAVVGRPGTYHYSLSDTLTLTQVTRVFGLVYEFSFSDTITFNQRVNSQYAYTIFDEITFFQSANPVNRFIERDFSDTIIVDEAHTKILEHPRTFSDLLELDELFNRQIDVTIGFSDELDLREQLSAVILTDDTTHPIVTSIPILYTNQMSIRSPLGMIVLPPPELNDSEKTGNEVNIRRSISGVTRSFVKRSNTRLLSYTWFLDYNKSLELRQFFVDNHTEPLVIENWKGEIWHVRLITTEIAATSQKAAGKARQIDSITLEFEGKRLI
jgi:hypothetical protein